MAFVSFSNDRNEETSFLVMYTLILETESLSYTDCSSSSCTTLKQMDNEQRVSVFLAFESTTSAPYT